MRIMEAWGLTRNLIGVLVVLQILGLVGAYLGPLLCLVAPVVLLGGIIVVGYMGYTLASKGFEIAESAVASGLASALINLVFGAVSFFAGLGSTAISGDAEGAMISGAFGIVGLFVGFIIGFIISSIIAAIGHFLYGATKKKK